MRKMLILLALLMVATSIAYAVSSPPQWIFRSHSAGKDKFFVGRPYGKGAVSQVQVTSLGSAATITFHFCRYVEGADSTWSTYVSANGDSLIDVLADETVWIEFSGPFPAAFLTTGGDVRVWAK